MATLNDLWGWEGASEHLLQAPKQLLKGFTNAKEKQTARLGPGSNLINQSINNYSD